MQTRNWSYMFFLPIKVIIWELLLSFHTSVAVPIAYISHTALENSQYSISKQTTTAKEEHYPLIHLKI